MKTGLHHMNAHVVRHATQGFANVIAAGGEEAKARGVAICMDCRIHSTDFARAAAEVMAGNGIRVRIFDALRPTPELSFAVREYHCQAGINITASHNPKEYNGYKVYWEDGAQLPPQHADAIAEELARIDIFRDIRSMDYDAGVAAGLITRTRRGVRRALHGKRDVHGQRSRHGGFRGRRIQDRLHALPRLRLQAGAAGSAPHGHEACDLSSRSRW